MTSDVSSRLKLGVITSGFSSVLPMVHHGFGIDLLIHNQLNDSPKRLHHSFKSLLMREVTAEQWAASNNVRSLTMRGRTSADISSIIQSENIDILVSYAAPILSNEIISAPRQLAINAHPADLPAYRGGNPLFWQILDGITDSAVTIHELTEEVDRGDILHKEPFQIPLGVDKSTVMRQVGKIVAKSIITALEKMSRDSLSKQPQPEHSPTNFAYNIRRSELTEKIDWKSLSAGQLFRVLRYIDDVPLDILIDNSGFTFFPLRAKSYQDYDKQDPGILHEKRNVYLCTRKGRVLLTRKLTLLACFRHWKSKFPGRATKINNQYL